jgi:hypothetical protein
MFINFYYVLVAKKTFWSHTFLLVITHFIICNVFICTVTVNPRFRINSTTLKGALLELLYLGFLSIIIVVLHSSAYLEHVR